MTTEQDVLDLATKVTAGNDNLDRLDSAINDPAGVWTTSTGVSVSNLRRRLAQIGYQVPVAFEAGLVAEDASFTVTYLGTTYSANPASTPFTTTGTFSASQWVVSFSSATASDYGLGDDTGPLIDDIDTWYRGGFAYGYGGSHVSATSGVNPFPDLNGLFHLTTVNSSLGIDDDYIHQTAYYVVVATDTAYEARRTRTNAGWSDWVTTISADDAINSRHFLSRSTAVTWCTANPTPPVGTEISIYASGAEQNIVRLAYIGSGTHFTESAFDGWVPVGQTTFEHFGAVGDGSTNDAAAILAAATYKNSIGGGTVYGLSRRYRIQTSITIPEGVVLKGPFSHVATPGYARIAPVTFTSGLVMTSPGQYVQTKDGETVTGRYSPKLSAVPFTTTSTFDPSQWDSHDGTRVLFNLDDTDGKLLIDNSAVLTLSGACGVEGFHIHQYGLGFRTADDSGFSGTAIRVMSGNGVHVRDCMISGFNRAIDHVFGSRMLYEDILIDCINGIRINDDWDVGHIVRCHCFPFITLGQGAGSGDDLLRSGIAYQCIHADWVKVTDCFAYGYYRGFVIASNSTFLKGCGSDNFAAVPEPGSIGFQINGARGKMVGCNVAAQEDDGVRVDVGTNGSFLISELDVWNAGLASTDPDVLRKTTNGVYVISGNVTVVSSRFQQCFNGIHVVDPNSNVMENYNNFINCTNDITIAPATDTSHVQVGAQSITNQANGVARVNVVGSYGITSLSAASTLALPVEGSVFDVSSTGTNITNISGGYAGRVVTLVFSGASLVVATVAFGTTLINRVRLSGDVDFTTGVPGATLTILHTGAHWVEIGRTA